MKKTTLSLVTLAFLISSCTESPKEQTHEKQATKKEVGLTLNNDNRWIANAETTAGVNNMITLIDSFTDNEDREAYTHLSENLNNEFGLIFKRCTMKGEAHYQLHTFLIPIKTWISKINSTKIADCKQNTLELRAHLNKYKEFFE